MDSTADVGELTNGDNTKRGPSRDIFFFPHIRTASHVLCRLLSNQPGFTQSDYHFYHAFNFARDAFGWGPLNDVSQENRKEFEKLLQEGFDEIQTDREAAAKQKKSIFLLKEHTFYIWEPSRLSQSMWGGPKSTPFTVVDKADPQNSGKTNPTLFPDNFLKSWRPIFLIRHPALSFESWYRAESGARHVDIFDKSWAFYTSFQYSRQLHDWFLSISTDHTSMPIVIDADDMLEKRSTINTLCELLGMDTQYIPDQWDTIQPPEGAGCRTLKFMSAYWSSTSIDPSKSSRGLDMAAKYNLWRDDFGADVADELWRLVEKAMPDYEYLKCKKI